MYLIVVAFYIIKSIYLCTGFFFCSAPEGSDEIVKISVINGTIPHTIIGKHGASRIFLKPASSGTGIIAGGPVRAVCEVLGIKDIVAKSLGTANPHNVIRACMKALSKQYSPKNISILRNKKISEIIEKRG